MRSIVNYILLLTGITVFLAACTKVEDLPYYSKGTKVDLATSATTVAPTLATADDTVVTFSWSDPKYGTDTSNYKFIVQIDAAGNDFQSPATRQVMGQRSAAFTGRDLNTILLNFGYPLGQPQELEVRVVSSYANNNEQYLSNVVTVAVTPFADPSTLQTSASTVTGSNLTNGTEKALTFSWTPAFPGYSGTVTYTLQYDAEGGDFSNPKEIVIGDNKTTLDMTRFELNETALAVGIAGGTNGTVSYRIKSVAAQGAVAYSDVVSVNIDTYVPIIRLYMPGSYQEATGQGTNWSPDTAPEFIRDMRSDVLNKLYYMYIYLPAGAEFKITEGRSWDVNYGGSGGNLEPGGSNFTVATAGVYRISVDLATKTYDIREGRMGIVGGATGAGWEPGNVFPNYALGYAAPNLFVGVFDFTDGEWKMIDNTTWNDGTKTPAETRSYGSNGGSGSTMEVNGPNFPSVGAAGRYRVIWDGRDPDNIKYEVSPAAEMRVVGNGIQGVAEWSPENSPQMTYAGNGVWTITLNLLANKEIKFLAGNAWGAFDYEDAGGGKIKWDGGPNFMTPATAGSYTITLNENTQSYTIN